MKLLVGLGNPGRKYQATRHNVGFEVLDDMARRYGRSSAREKFQGLVVEADLGGQPALLLQPQTFMNRSGGSVRQACDFYKLPAEEVLVVCDDFNLPLGKLRLRASGSAGGQKGLADIIRSLGTEEVSRLRIGIGTPPPPMDAADFVLSRFHKDEQSTIEQAIWRAADAAVFWAREGAASAMNQYNV